MTRRLIKLERNKSFKGFEIEQADPSIKELGIGPYRLTYMGKEIFRARRHSECRDHLEDIVKEHRKILRDLQKMKHEFTKKYKTRSFPDNL